MDAAAAEDVSPYLLFKGIAAWTDPAAIDLLAKDCRVKAPAGDEEYGGYPLSCNGGLYHQGCAYDICYGDEQTKCAPRCEHACDACFDECGSSCETCKSGCAAGDAACVHACAQSCGACRSACLSIKDTCATGTCGTSFTACRKKTRARWFASPGCATACGGFEGCMAGCTTTHAQDACTSFCAKGRGCPVDLLWVCERWSAADLRAKGPYPPATEP